MNIEHFTTNNGCVQAVLADLREHVGDKVFSDIIDDEGHQYVDLVMEGGGMLGIALVGYVYTMEQMGIRFLQLGGTSAGSINALLMAAAGPKKNAASDWLIEVLANKNFNDFVDGDADARNFVQAITQKSSWKKIAWRGAQVIDNLREDFGLNPGDSFHNWVTSLLQEKGVDTWAKLKHLRQQGNELLRLRNGKSFVSDTAGRIAIVAADITTQTKVCFPEMAELYWETPEQVNPAHFVRASMSIPFFFHPFRITNLPFGTAMLKKWREIGYFGNVPDEVFLVDGGINSNFPIDLFHNTNKVPAAPTFGVKLGVDRHHPRLIHKIPDMVGAIFDSARQVHDMDFIIRNPDYRHLVHYLETDGFNWLEFNMPDEEKLRLFEVGVKGASSFLRKFDWAKYKNLRATIAKANHQSDDMVADAAVEKLMKEVHPHPHKK